MLREGKSREVYFNCPKFPDVQSLHASCTSSRMADAMNSYARHLQGHAKLTAERLVQVAWMNGLMDFVFPYLIQFLKEYTGKTDALWKDKKERQEAAVDEESAKKQQEAQTNAYLQLMPLALPAPPGRRGSSASQ